jgi:hypothetical protein
MHTSCLDFVARTLKPEHVTGKRVLEVGSQDVNGSVRPLVTGMWPASYLGVDQAPGQGVDEVRNVDDLEATYGPGKFDLVITTEMLEHVRDWRAAVMNLKAMAAAGGLLLVTTRSVGFPYHAYPEDHWRYELDDMRAIFADFDLLTLESDPPPAYGVLMLARKTARPAVNLEPIELCPMTPAGAGLKGNMKQASDSGWYSTQDGGEVFIQKGTVRPDNHPDVKAVPALFLTLPSEEAPKKATAAKDKS